MKPAEVNAKVKALHKELQANEKKIPESWIPWLGLIKFFLKIVKIFTPDNVDAMIDEILAAIKEYEEENPPA